MEAIEQVAPALTGALPSLSDILAENPGWLDSALDAEEAEEITGTPKATLSTLRNRGGGPKFFKRGARVLYRRRALFEWLAEHRDIASTSEIDNQT